LEVEALVLRVQFVPFSAGVTVMVVVDVALAPVCVFVAVLEVVTAVEPSGFFVAEPRPETMAFGEATGAAAGAGAGAAAGAGGASSARSAGQPRASASKDASTSSRV
jgi:hypothetical protein